MKKIFLLITIGLIVIFSCDQEPKEQATMFEYEYGGRLDITMTCNEPEFIAQGSVLISIDINGIITSESSTLTYAGESVMPGGQSKIRRDGSITFNPYGDCSPAENGDFTINLYENASGTEDMKLWVWNGTSWELYIEENDIPIDWNGGLAFSLNKALTESGDTVGIQVSTGTVQFKLMLMGVSDI